MERKQNLIDTGPIANKFLELWQEEGSDNCPLSKKAKIIAAGGKSVPAAISEVMLLRLQEITTSLRMNTNLPNWITDRLSDKRTSLKEAVNALYVFGFFIPPITINWASNLKGAEQTDMEIIESLNYGQDFLAAKPRENIRENLKDYGSATRSVENYLNTKWLIENTAKELKNDPTGLSAFWSLVNLIADVTASDNKKLHSLAIADFTFPLSARAQEALENSPMVSGSIICLNLYGRIYGNAFATKEERQEALALRKKFRK